MLPVGISLRDLLPTAVPPCQVLQLEHAEDQGDGGHGQHEHNEHVFLRRPGDVAVHGMRTRPCLKHREAGDQAAIGLCLYARKIVRIFSYFHLADIERIEEDPVHEILETEKHHLCEGGGVVLVCKEVTHLLAARPC